MDSNGKVIMPLFTEFTPPTREEWIDIVKSEMKDSDFEKKLVWKTYEGIDVQPMYFREDLDSIKHLDFLPGMPPFARGSTSLESAGKPWSINQEAALPCVKKANEAIRKALNAGQNGVTLVFDLMIREGMNPDKLEKIGMEGISILDIEDLSRLLEDVPLEKYTLVFNGGFSSEALLAMFSELAEKRNIKTEKISGAFEHDPLSHLILNGALPGKYTDITRRISSAIEFAKNRFPGMKVVAVSAVPFHNSGADIVQELAFTLAVGIEYVHALSQHGLSVDDIASSMRFTFPVGANFFMEIAKLRAARMLWAKIIHHFGPVEASSMAMDMHVRTSEWRQTRYDPWVNMLRATVECMAGSLGGTRSMHAAPFDDAIGFPNGFSSRIARNTQIILQEEAYLTKVIDPAAGSYYIEMLTDQVARHTWEMLCHIEEHGGILKALESGMIQEMISGSAARKNKNISTRKDVFIGTNQYPNLEEKPIETFPIDHDALKKELAERLNALKSKRTEEDFSSAMNALAVVAGGGQESIMDAAIAAVRAGATIGEINRALYPTEVSSDIRIEPLCPYRGAELFESIRNAVEKLDKRPRAFLATMGPLTWCRARAGFSSGFLGVAGFDVIDNIGFNTTDEAVNAAIASNAEIIVFCADDESYPEIVPEMIGTLKSKNDKLIFIVAGRPKDAIEILQEAGVDEFIHVKSDAGKVLADLASRFGINVK